VFLCSSISPMENLATTADAFPAGTLRVVGSELIERQTLVAAVAAQRQRQLRPDLRVVGRKSGADY
jgi:hypothetical protein